MNAIARLSLLAAAVVFCATGCAATTDSDDEEETESSEDALLSSTHCSVKALVPTRRQLPSGSYLVDARISGRCDAGYSRSATIYLLTRTPGESGYEMIGKTVTVSGANKTYYGGSKMFEGGHSYQTHVYALGKDETSAIVRF